MSPSFLINHLWILASICFVIYSQCIIMWRLRINPVSPTSFSEVVEFLFVFLLNPWVISALTATFMSGLFWIMALKKFELSYAYPWMASVFVIMLIVGVVVFKEPATTSKFVGTTLVFIGLVIAARG